MVGRNRRVVAFKFRVRIEIHVHSVVLQSSLLLCFACVVADVCHDWIIPGHTAVRLFLKIWDSRGRLNQRTELSNASTTVLMMIASDP